MRVGLSVFTWLLILSCFVVSQADASIEKYERLATEYWHAVPECDSVEYTWQDDLLEATGVINAVGAATLGGCQMWIKTPFWFSVNKAVRCTIFLHEWGHLLGYVHMESGIMELSPDVPNFCNRRGWYAQRSIR